MTRNHNIRNPREVKSIRTMFRIVGHLQDRDGSRVTDIATELDLAKSSVHQHLSTLADLGYVVKEDDTYYLGLGFLHLAEYARQRKEAYRLARPMVQELAEESGERAQFFVEEHGRAIYLHTYHGRNAVPADRTIGTRRYMHSSAGGKAILAYYPEWRVDEIIERWGMPAETGNTITSRSGLGEELEAIRDRGYAINNNESIEGLRALGVAVKDPEGSVFGSFSISGPFQRFKDERIERSLTELLLGKANEYELKIAYS